jgi:CheY-like chemotaxis protein
MDGAATTFQDAPERARTSAVRAYRSATVLYIEDNAPNFILIEQVFAKRPAIGILPATTGLRGLELARRYRPALVLLDLHLPDMPGEKVLEQLRADWRTNGVPVIVISADATDAGRECLLAAGAHAYLTKPLDVRQFLEIVDDVLMSKVSDAYG